MPTEREVTIEQFRQHLREITMGRSIDEVMIHHTWSPTAAQYRGIETVRGVRRYHMQVRGWSDNGYHVMIGPDGRLFLCRPFSRAGAHVAGRNAHSIGVAFIANFDREEPDAFGGMGTGLQVVAALLERFDLAPAAVRFHREFAPKTCPGRKLSLAEFRRRVVEVGARQATELKVVLPENRVVACAARVEDGVTRVALRPLAEALGWRVCEHIADQGKIYLAR